MPVTYPLPVVPAGVRFVFRGRERRGGQTLPGDPEARAALAGAVAAARLRASVTPETRPGGVPGGDPVTTGREVHTRIVEFTTMSAGTFYRVMKVRTGAGADPEAVERLFRRMRERWEVRYRTEITFV